MLPQQNQFLAQFVFHLHAMQVHWNLQTAERILSVDNTMMLLHIEQFDREDVGRPLEFLARHAEGRRLLLPVPPLCHRRQSLQRLERADAQNAKQVQVREPGMKIAGNHRSKKYDTLDVRAAGFACAFCKFVNDVYSNHGILALPAAASSPTPGAAATKSAKAAPAAEPAASSPITPASATESAAAAKDVREQQPKQDAAKWSDEDDDEDNEQYYNSAKRKSSFGSLHAGHRCAGLGVRKLNARVRSDDIRHSGSDQQQRLVVIPAAHQRDGFALETSHLAVGKDGL